MFSSLVAKLKYFTALVLLSAQTLSFALLLAIASALFAVEVLADTTRGRLASDRVLHTPAIEKNLYSKSRDALSKAEAWKIRLHGLRMAPLDPHVWAIRRIDQTDNRKLVPIRPYFLRASEQQTFRLKEVLLRFAFESVGAPQMLDAPSLHSPVFDIEFAGEFRMGLPGRRPAEDSAYLYRVSSTPLFESGFFYRSFLKSKRIDSAAYEFTPGRSYELRIATSSTDAEVFVDNKKIAAISGENFSSGLLSLIVGWHPIRVEKLEVLGSLENKVGERSLVSYSGLLGVEEAK